MTEPDRIHVRRNLRFLPLVLLLLILLELLWSQRVWMMLLLALGGIWLFDYLWARSLARGLRLTRQVRYGWAQVGDNLEERFTLAKEGYLPALWVELLDASSLPDYQATTATGIDGDAETTWRTEHVCSRRGIFTLGPTLLRSGTPFGLYTVTLEYAARTSLVVMPPVVPLPEIQVAAGGRAYEGKRRASTLEQTVSVSGVREYRQGDSFRAMHWRSVAHRDEWMVRTFESTPAGDWWIWLDLAASEQAGVGENSTVEHAVILAASLAERGLRTGHAVGLAVKAGALTWLPPQGGEAQRLRILRTLATVEPGDRPLGEVLLQLRQAVTQTSSVIIITPAVEGQWMDAVLSLKARAVMPTVLLLDRATFGGAGNVNATTALLADWGIPYFVVTRDLLHRSETRPGRTGRWEWAVNATGRAVSRDAAVPEGAWRTLS